jgi:nucleoside-diphosphate-sugar epimerase
MIAILGATGYVGRSLARAFADGSHRPLVLFARDPSRLSNEAWPAHVRLEALDALHAEQFDLVINCIGAGDPARVRATGAALVSVTDFWDQRLLETMRDDAKYVFMSSGAVYGTQFDAPVDADSQLCIPVNRLDEFSPYVFAKLSAEFRHRQLPSRHILDLRLFAYADRSIPGDGTFFLAELARSLRCRSTFATHASDFVRDYVGPEELFALISAWERAGAPSLPADVYTLAPVSKVQLLEEVQRRFDLDIQWTELPTSEASNLKSFYASNFKVAASFGYEPWRTSLDVVLATLNAIAN